MNKFIEILRSWGIQLNPNEKQSKLAEARIAICDTCEHKKTSPTIHCGVCGCLLKSKIFSPVENACPEGKWAEVDRSMSKEIKELSEQATIDVEHIEVPLVQTEKINEISYDSINQKKTYLKSPIFISVQPADLYSAWQVEVMLNNFLSKGVNVSNIHLVQTLKDNQNVPKEWMDLLFSFQGVNFYFYSLDTNSDLVVSSKYTALKKHWIENPDLAYRTVFIHDNSMIITRDVDKWITESMMSDDIWYGSDLFSELSYSYLESLGDDVLSKLSRSIDIDKDMILNNSNGTIGKHYLLKNVDSSFWDRVESDCLVLYRTISNIKAEFERYSSSDLKISVWDSEMLSILWNSWREGKKTLAYGNLEFSRATSNENDWYKYNLFNNIDIPKDSTEFFQKTDYRFKLPYLDSLQLKDRSASKKYWELIQQTGKNSCLLK